MLLYDSDCPSQIAQLVLIAEKNAKHRNAKQNVHAIYCKYVCLV